MKGSWVDSYILTSILGYLMNIIMFVYYYNDLFQQKFAFNKKENSPILPQLWGTLKRRLGYVNV